MTSTKDSTFFDSGLVFLLCPHTPAFCWKKIISQQRMDPVTSALPEILEAHAEHVRETLRLAASLGRVAIVTLAASLGGWISDVGIEIPMIPGTLR